MDKEIVSVFKLVAIIALIFSLILQNAGAVINVGVKTGDWVRYEYYDHRNGASEPHFWLKLTVTDVNGTIVSFHAETNSTQFAFSDGHVDVAYNCFAYLVSAPVVPMNLSAGDTVPTGTVHVTINDTTQFIGREAAHLVLPGSLGSDQWYWDLETGVLLAYSTFNGTVSMTVADTNLFMIIPEFSSLPFLLIPMIIIPLMIALRRKKASFLHELSK